MGQSRHRFEDLIAITKETLQIIQSLIPASVTLKPPHKTKAATLHKFPRYVFEELHNLQQLITAHADPAFDELLGRMTTLMNICRSLDPALAGAEDGEITPIVIEPSHLDLIRSVVSNLEFSLLGLIMTAAQSRPDSSTDPQA